MQALLRGAHFCVPRRLHTALYHTYTFGEGSVYTGCVLCSLLWVLQADAEVQMANAGSGQEPLGEWDQDRDWRWAEDEHDKEQGHC